GAGPVGASGELRDYLPVPAVERTGDAYRLDYSRPKTVGRLKGFYANSAILLRAYCYIRLLGADGLDNVSSLAVLGANYLLSKLNTQGYSIPVGGGSMGKEGAVVFERRGR